MDCKSSSIFIWGRCHWLDWGGPVNPNVFRTDFIFFKIQWGQSGLGGGGGYFSSQHTMYNEYNAILLYKGVFVEVWQTMILENVLGAVPQTPVYSLLMCPPSVQ